MSDPKETEVLSNYKTDLTVRLHPEEVHDHAKRLAAIEGEMAQHDERAKSVKADLAAQKAKLSSERSNVAMKVRTETEVRQVPCTIVAHFATNRAVTSRDDTGEVIAERPLANGERQALLKLDESKSMVSDLLASAKEKPAPVITPKECGAVTLGGICTAHGSDCPNPETIPQREAKAADKDALKKPRRMTMIDTPPPTDPTTEAPKEPTDE